MKKSPSKSILALLLVSALLLLPFCKNTAFSEALSVKSYVITDEKIEKTVKLLMISDLHGSFYGKDQEELLQKIEDLAPDVLLLAGDIFDEKSDFSAAEALLSGVSGRYPCYYVSGNHEYVTDFQKVKETLERYGVICLWGTGRVIRLQGQKLFLAGAADENHALYFATPSLPSLQEQISALDSERGSREDLFSVLLCHRPEADFFEKYSFDLILSGHNHGGQFRIPHLINGLYAPGQGLFPKYAGGLYTLKHSKLIVGRGLTKGTFPRLFNRPELIYIEIRPAKT